jgi:hypothetical protein
MIAYELWLGKPVGDPKTKKQKTYKVLDEALNALAKLQNVDHKQAYIQEVQI